MTLYVIEKFSEEKEAFLPTGNVSRDELALAHVLERLERNSPGPTRRIKPYAPAREDVIKRAKVT